MQDKKLKLFGKTLNYVIYGLIYLILHEIIGFELTVIIALGQILGELKSN